MGAADSAPDLGDFRDYCEAREWPPASLRVGYPDEAESDAWIHQSRQIRTEMHFRRPPRGRDRPIGAIRPYEENDGRRFQIALILKTIRDCVGGLPEYRPLGVQAAKTPHCVRSGNWEVVRYSRPRGLGSGTIRPPVGRSGLRADRGRAVPGGCTDGPHPPPTTHWEEGFRPDRSAQGRIDTKSAWGI